MKTRDSDTGADADAEAWVERIRERVRSLPAARREPSVPASLADPGFDLTTLHATSEVRHPALGSHRKLFGPVILVFKRLLLRLLAPSLEPQAEHNAAATRLLTHYALRLERLEQRLEGLSRRIGSLEAAGEAAEPAAGAPAASPVEPP